MSQPELALRNPDKLAYAWQLQHYDRELFIAYFGADTVVIDGSDLRRRWSEYWQWRRRQPATPGGQAIFAPNFAHGGCRAPNCSFCRC